MKITLEQFKKFAAENDILWFYNKPKWKPLPLSITQDALYSEKINAVLKKLWLEGNWYEAQFGTPEEREKERKNSKEISTRTNCHKQKKEKP